MIVHSSPVSCRPTPSFGMFHEIGEGEKAQTAAKELIEQLGTQYKIPAYFRWAGNKVVVVAGEESDWGNKEAHIQQHLSNPAPEDMPDSVTELLNSIGEPAPVQTQLRTIREKIARCFQKIRSYFNA